jgi:hypothetical protein
MKSWILIVVLASGCGAAASGGTQETLAEAIRSFNDGVRWQRYQTAASRLPVKERSRFVDEMDKRADELRITDYEIITVDAKGREAKVHIKVEWYKDTEQVLRTTHTTQTWERHGKTWLLIDEVKLRGHDMPGLVDRTGVDVSASSDKPL